MDLYGGPPTLLSGVYLSDSVSLSFSGSKGCVILGAESHGSGCDCTTVFDCEIENGSSSFPWIQ